MFADTFITAMLFGGVGPWRYH